MKHKKTLHSFVNAIQKAMRVCGRGDSGVAGYPAKMTQLELAAATGVSRSTLANHKGTDSDEARLPNPTLENICKIAERLNVPPAFLLMRPEDWTRLAQAVDFYAKLRQSQRTHPLFSTIVNSSNLTPPQQASLGFELARLLNIDGRANAALLEASSAPDRVLLLEEETARKLSIYATSTLPPMNYMQADEKLAAFFVSVIFGAHHKPES